MPTIVVTLQELGVSLQLQESLEKNGHRTLGAESDPDSVVADLVIISGEKEDCSELCQRWRDTKSAPAIVILGHSDKARSTALALRAIFLPADASAEQQKECISTALGRRYTARLNQQFAFAYAGAEPSGDSGTDAEFILKFSREVPPDFIRKALRWHATDYVYLKELTLLRERRALLVPEIELCKHLDGTRTLQTLASNAQGVMAGRAIWALACSGLVSFHKEPPHVSLACKRLSAARENIRIRFARENTATNFDRLEVPRSASPQEVDYAARTLAVRFSPDVTDKLDLGELRAPAKEIWEEILHARMVLMDTVERSIYLERVDAQGVGGSWTRAVTIPRKAEEAYRKAQAALIDGEAHVAVGSLAKACKEHPDHPVYETALCWARFRAEVARGGNRDELAKKERGKAEAAMAGYRPWPQALVALALLCSADGDPISAQHYLSEALTVDPNLPAAKQLMARLKSGAVETPVPKP